MKLVYYLLPLLAILDNVRADDRSVGTIVPIFVGAILVAAIIFSSIFCPLFYLRSTFGFPFCSGRSEFCCICSPYCYCAGGHLREDHTGVLKVKPCFDCCYSTLCGCERPPPELLIPAHIHWIGPTIYINGKMQTRLGIYRHSDVLRVMRQQQDQQPIVAKQPTGFRWMAPANHPEVMPIMQGREQVPSVHNYSATNWTITNPA